MENKKGFVSNYLKPLLIATDSCVADAYYERRPHDGYIGDEYVVIVYTNGYKKDVCVTADSLSALTRDVMKHL
jgi:hypothetical protein